MLDIVENYKNIKLENKKLKENIYYLELDNKYLKNENKRLEEENIEFRYLIYEATKKLDSAIRKG